MIQSIHPVRLGLFGTRFKGSNGSSPVETAVEKITKKTRELLSCDHSVSNGHVIQTLRLTKEAEPRLYVTTKNPRDKIVDDFLNTAVNCRFLFRHGNNYFLFIPGVHNDIYTPVLIDVESSPETCFEFQLDEKGAPLKKNPPPGSSLTPNHLAKATS